MSALKRLELTIDVNGLAGQRALVLAALKPADLIGNILQEFREIEHLGTRIGDYQLLRSTDDAPLDEAQPLGTQLNTGAHLRLTERLAPPPAGAACPAKALYLRERSSGDVYRLGWVPAIIGRADASLAENELLAVDLTAHPAGQRVSRRHARLFERGGDYLVARLSPNPVAIADSAGRLIAVEEVPIPLRAGDTLILERSQIALTFLMRYTAPA